MRSLIALTLFVVVSAGCMPDSMLAEREEATGRLRAQADQLAWRVSKFDAYRRELELAVNTGSGARNAAALIRELRREGFSVQKSDDGGVIKLGLIAPVMAGGEKLDAGTLTRLSRAAALLREYLPNHELSIESNDIQRAVATVRALNERAGVPGLRLRAVTGGRAGALLVEIRPTQIEALQEVLAATVD
jgi:hypothetical protein